ncbi:hypothetical protein MLD38_019785 [Melastoma candidum]|uniref:Uncharacterized protein n=1 Tax=Melastoma candidum TaxID=119954 RepID=A0ACB9QX95_9MYRT|nr:hypothetical protein MLD38_019785 [Melastoma candidum]
MDTRTPLPLAVESFSRSWLPIPRPSLEAHLPPPHCDPHPDIRPHQDFYFDVPAVSCPTCDTFAHADELFSCGTLKVVLSDSSHLRPISSIHSTALSGGTPSRHSLLRRLRKSFARAIQRCFWGVRPVCIRLTNSRGMARVTDIDPMEREYRGGHCLGESSSSTGCTHSHYSHGEESPIDEAILHCKRSVGMMSGYA